MSGQLEQQRYRREGHSNPRVWSSRSTGVNPVAPDSEEGQVLDGVASLTPQQRAVFQLVAEGRPNKQIAHALNISITTVKAHVSAILMKLGVTSRTQAVILAKRYSLFI